MRQNIYGQLIMTEAEQAYIHQTLTSQPCPICGAGAGQDCQREFTPRTRNLGRKVKRSMGQAVHFGRVPQGWDNYQVLRAAGFQDEQQASYV